ncbi:hypothetical protein N9124_01695 [bacterium]|nr:hypothetical protein [bacterium]MDB4525843.1 hypothetical protein [Akkermansiaceae bacterium]MDB4588177.1 hypothetical protein [bacterium]
MNNKILRLTLIIITALSLASCQKSLEEQIIGKWVNKGKGEMVMEFLEGGDLLFNRSKSEWSIIDDDRIRLDLRIPGNYRGSDFTLIMEDVLIEDGKMKTVVKGASGERSELTLTRVD